MGTNTNATATYTFTQVTAGVYVAKHNGTRVATVTGQRGAWCAIAGATTAYGPTRAAAVAKALGHTPAPAKATPAAKAAPKRPTVTASVATGRTMGQATPCNMCGAPAPVTTCGQCAGAQCSNCGWCTGHSATCHAVGAAYCGNPCCGGCQACGAKAPCAPYGCALGAPCGQCGGTGTACVTCGWCYACAMCRACRTGAPAPAPKPTPAPAQAAPTAPGYPQCGHCQRPGSAGGMCTNHSGTHRMRNGVCTRCGHVATPTPAPATPAAATTATQAPAQAAPAPQGAPGRSGARTALYVALWALALALLVVAKGAGAMAWLYGTGARLATRASVALRVYARTL